MLQKQCWHSRFPEFLKLMHPDEMFSILRPVLVHGDNGDSIIFNALFQEFGVWAIVLLLTTILLVTRPAFFQKIENYAKRVSRNRALVVVSLIFLALATRAILLFAVPYPVPVVHDEFSYLLQASTFASGRVTNPTPAGWQHFETFHVNMLPSYQSMYPPGQALFMAAAQFLHLHPWWGVWLSVGLMCGAVCWMLQGWMPSHWALLGGLFCVIRFSAFSYWVNTYWGGAVAAIGGALLLGSLPRLKRNKRPWHGLLFVLGLAILANTRPYEGLIFSIPAVFALLVWLLPAWSRGEVKLAAMVPALSVLVVIGLSMAYYNWRGTGSLTMMPYAINHAEYHITRPFLWQARLPIHEYRHPVMRTFYIYHELPDYLRRSYSDGLIDLLRNRVSCYYNFFIWPMLIPTIFAMWAMMKSRKNRIFPITLLLVLAGLVIEQWPPHDHYAAPILGAAVMVVIYGLRLTRLWKPRGIPLGPMLVRSLALVVIAFCLIATGKKILNPFQIYSESRIVPEELERERLIADLQGVPGNHLVFVHLLYNERGSIFWIYNDPDLVHSRIIWAHDMGEAENRELMKLYPNRKVWIVDKDNFANKLMPYPETSTVAGFVGPPLASVRAGETHAR